MICRLHALCLSVSGVTNLRHREVVGQPGRQEDNMYTASFIVRFSIQSSLSTDRFQSIDGSSTTGTDQMRTQSSSTDNFRCGNTVQFISESMNRLRHGRYRPSIHPQPVGLNRDQI
ncbi:hypothetical protein BaRGS_00032850 [Batillaria attramentaria]|uniref:Secreted protein n=1 Tax=Batillaria attramentaria TaxID=370345 RepID=A0ABD0JLK6_9CAEN